MQQKRKMIGGLRDISDIHIPWEDPEIVWRKDAYTIVTCNTQWDYQMESYFLAHCLGTKDHAAFGRAHMVYSLRDPLGIPHATILCLREGEFSPYGMCWDVGGVEPFTPAPLEHNLRILQVRGRNDDVAMPLFHAYVREWYAHMGGKIAVDMVAFIKLLARVGDDDFNYHFGYLLDESTNHFQWAHWNEKMVELARLEGTSL